MVPQSVSWLLGLTPLKSGIVVKFDYPQAQRENITKFVKITNIRDTKRQPILTKSKYANPIKRERYLVTAYDTRGVVRTYYPEICDVVYICGPLYRVAYYVLRVWHKIVG